MHTENATRKRPPWIFISEAETVSVFMEEASQVARFSSNAPALLPWYPNEPDPWAQTNGDVTDFSPGSCSNFVKA